jgi:hypothetical protein
MIGWARTLALISDQGGKYHLDPFIAELFSRRRASAEAG